MLNTLLTRIYFVFQNDNVPLSPTCCSEDLHPVGNTPQVTRKWLSYSECLWRVAWATDSSTAVTRIAQRDPRSRWRPGTLCTVLWCWRSSSKSWPPLPRSMLCWVWTKGMTAASHHLLIVCCKSCLLCIVVFNLHYLVLFWFFIISLLTSRLQW